ncbi:MAG: galactose mutarotase [Sphingomonas fennica]
MIHVAVTPHPAGAVYRIAAAGGIAVTVASAGATLMRIDAPDRHGRSGNVILGLDDIAAYPAAGGPGGDACMGGTCGRFANRIAGARFDLDGRTVRLAPNEGPNQLHGGPDGFHRRRWQGRVLADGVRLTLESADGDQGWPGRLTVAADFRLIDAETLAISYRARTDRPTHVNIVSHPYFNLDGAGDILGHRLSIAADTYLPIDAAALPAGPPRAVAGTPFDFRGPRAVGDAIDADDEQLRHGAGYNHCYLPAGTGLRPVAHLASTASGRTMTLSTDQPGLQFYSGNALSAAAGGFPDRAGFCLEAQAWPDAPNRPDAPSTRLDPGETYRSELRLRFGADGAVAVGRPAA